jgi:TonB-linked SusC/RagA family outer membrane protein
MKKLLIFISFLLLPLLSLSQESSGTVFGTDGLPLPGVNVTTGQANTVTDFDGKFAVNASPGETITFTMVGFKTQTSKPGINLRIILQEAVNSLNEVVVIGYGTKKAGTITGSVSQIKTEDILRTPAQSAVQAIQGKAAGVNIVSNDEPGKQPSIRIRGLGTVLGARDPLYVIDGVEATSLNGVSPNDIVTIDILKDASSLAIFGQKGSMGVVLITTKKGKKGDIKVNFDSSMGIKNILKKVKLADSYNFAYFNNYVVGSNTLYNFSQPYNTDWLEEITQTGSYTNNALSFSGANETSNYYLGVSHYTEEGILKGSDFKRTNVNSRNEFRLFGDKFKITQLVNFSTNRSTPKPLSAFTNAYKQSPIMPVRYPNGQYAWPFRNPAGVIDMTGIKFNDVGNPVAQLDYNNEKSRTINLFGNIGTELQLLKFLKYNSSFGATFDWTKGYIFVPDRDLWLLANPSLTAENYATQGNDRINTLTQKRYDSYVWNWDNYLTFNKSWGKHDFTVVAGMSRTTTDNNENFNGTRYNVPVQDNYWTLNLSSDNTATNPLTTVFDEHSTPIVSLAYFVRLEYSFNEKYLLTASARREGTSIFLKDRRTHTFPGVSAGWVVSKESFLQDNKTLNFLKIRAGYGEVGNARIPSNNLAFTPGTYGFGEDPLINQGYYLANAVDPNLTWETMTELDLGIDFRLLNNKLGGSLDYYERTNDNVILPVKLPPAISEGDVYLNTGEVSNKGFEVSLRWDDDINDRLRYWIGGNFSYNTNKLETVESDYFKNITGSGGLPNGEWTKKVVVGDPLGSFYVFQTNGFDSNGQFTYNDMVDGKPGLSDDDRVFAGSYIPTYTYGANLGVSYRGVDLSVDIYGVGGNKVFNGKKATRLGDINIEADQLDNFYTAGNTAATNPAPSNIGVRPSDYFIESGAFMRINNITLAYTLPKMIKEVNMVKIFVTAVNPFIFTEFSGYSPELVGDDNANPLRTAGIELDSYPTNKTFSIGLNMIF